MKLFVWALVALFQVCSAQKFVITEGLPCQDANCAEITLQHYHAMECEPVFNDTISTCCPASFDCKTEEQRGIKPNECYYRGKAYKDTQEVPLQNPCRLDCLCREFEGRASVECANIECPFSTFGVQAEEGCLWVGEAGRCCRKQVCGNEAQVVRSSTLKCPGDDGNNYNLGDKMYFKKFPCRTCTCTEDYTDPYGPGCREIECGIEYSDRLELNKGCTPRYHNGGCCPSEYICPGSNQVLPSPEQVSTGKESPRTHCTLGDIVAPRGDILKTDSCDMNCVCATPPMFTCIKYSTCDEAAEARKTGVLP